MEFYEDHFTEYPEEARRVRAKNGEFYFEHTGDELFDKWEKELSDGLEPDLEEGLSQEAKAQLYAERDKVSRVQKQTHELGLTDPRYQSKMVTPNSKEEQALLSRRMLGQGSNDKWVDLLGEDHA